MGTEVVTKSTPMGDGGVQLRSVEDAWRFAQTVVKSGLAPKSMKTAEQVLIAMQTGMEVGLSPMRALNAVVVINGTPSWKGDAAAALILQSGLATSPFQTRYHGSDDDYACTVSIERQGRMVSASFSVAQAKAARLWGKSGPWTDYSDRMLYYRALGFLGRDHFGDVLFGLRIAEEARDIEPEASKPEPIQPSTDPLLEEVLKLPESPQLPEMDSIMIDEAPEPEEPWADLDTGEIVESEPPDNAEWLAVVLEKLTEKKLAIDTVAAIAKNHTASGSLETATVEELKSINSKLETL